MVKKKQHGGKRPNAGRKQISPDGPAVVVTASVPSGLVDRMDEMAKRNEWSRSEAVTQAIRGLVGKTGRS
jgi:hypothetical protein